MVREVREFPGFTLVFSVWAWHCLSLRPRGVGGGLLAGVELQPLLEVVQDDVDLPVEDEGLLGLRGLLPFILLPGWFLQEVLVQPGVGLLGQVAGVAHVDLLAGQQKGLHPLVPRLF